MDSNQRHADMKSFNYSQIEFELNRHMWVQNYVIDSKSMNNNKNLFYKITSK
jgi:hypothetical protein